MPNRKYIKSFYIPVGRGDIVSIEIPGVDGMKKMTCRVSKVELRYGLINNGTSKRSPLLTVNDIDSDEERHCDNSYVTEVIKHGGIYPPENYFREHPDSGLARMLKTDKKSILCGTLTLLAEFILSKLNIALSHPFDPIKLNFLYAKNGLGCVKRDRAIFWVRRKYFEKWIRKNVYRILMTSAQLNKEETDANNAWEDDYWEKVESDLD